MFGMWILYYLLLCSLHRSIVSASYQQVWRRDPAKYKPGVTTERLQEVFQSYPVERYHTDQNVKWLRTCEGLSGKNRETNHAQSSRLGDTANPKLAKPCKSILQNCRFEKSLENTVHFCLSKDKSRRYDYMKTYKKPVKQYTQYLRGHYYNGCTSFETYYNYGGFYPCICDCESSENQADRYFSLLDVLADKDKVVTGIRIKKKNHVFHIEIQQGTLGPHRKIVGKAKWKPLKSIATSDLLSKNVSEYVKTSGDDLLQFKKNNLVYAVTFEQKTILLDDLVAGPDMVVTGLRFQQVDEDLRLEIQVTPFDDETGKLEKDSSRWMHSEVDKGERKLVKLEKPTDAAYFTSDDNTYIKFQTSDFKEDLGQATVPYIDIQDVVTKQPSPLFGAGIFFRWKKKVDVGFIALKGFYDVSS